MMKYSQQKSKDETLLKCSEPECTKKASVICNCTKSLKHCSKHILSHFIEDNCTIRSLKKSRYINPLNTISESGSFINNISLLNHLCLVIAKAYFPLLEDISKKIKKDKSYRKKDENNIVELVLGIYKKLQTIDFDSISCNSISFVEVGFANFLAESVKSFKDISSIDSSFCKIISKNLPSMLEATRYIEDPNHALYNLECLLTKIDLHYNMSRSKKYQLINGYEYLLYDKISPLDKYTHDKILKLFSIDYFRVAYQNFLPKTKNFDNLLLEALSKTYIADLFDEHGITLLNHTIFIKDRSDSKETTIGVCKDHPLKKYHDENKINSIILKREKTVIGYIIINFCHELANFMQRVECKTFGDVKKVARFKESLTNLPNKLVPIPFSSFNDSFEYEYRPSLKNQDLVKLPTKRYRNSNQDDGYMVELLLFGEVMEHLNYKTANYLLSDDLPLTIEEFRYKLNELNRNVHRIKALNFTRPPDCDFRPIGMGGRCGRNTTYSLF